ncbi:putative nucleic acid-binding protein [Catenulispora sp. GAS73]
MNHRTALFLVDNSAFARWRQPSVAAVLDPLHERGLLAVTGPIEMEVMYSARNGKEAMELRSFLSGFDYLPCDDEAWTRALNLRRQAVARGNHRALSTTDLLICAVAERHSATTLHYDQDFEQIAALAGDTFTHRWVAPAGTVD